MKNSIRKWLGIDVEAQQIDNNFHALMGELQAANLRIFQVFHTLPFVAGVLTLQARDAVNLTLPGGVTQNNLLGLLTGIISEARQGNSSMQVEGELPADVRESLIKRGFQIEEVQGSKETGTHILWT